jgi:uncharacterized SAM-binding protein YcdF (DUF218 family)
MKSPSPANRTTSSLALVVRCSLCGALIGLICKELHLQALLSIWRPAGPLVPIGMALGALLSLTRLEKMIRWLAAGTLLLWLLVAFSPLTRWLAKGLLRADTLTSADAIYVLASRMQADGDPSDAAEARLLRGLELLGEGRAHRLILGELPPPAGSYAALARDMMRRLGTGDNAELLLVGPVDSTQDEAHAVATLMQSRGFKRLLLVTSPIHTRRSSLSFEKEGLEVMSAPCRETLYDFEALEEPDDRVLAFGALLHERLGIVYYRFRGWL